MTRHIQFLYLVTIRQTLDVSEYVRNVYVVAPSIVEAMGKLDGYCSSNRIAAIEVVANDSPYSKEALVMSPEHW